MKSMRLWFCVIVWCAACAAVAHRPACAETLKSKPPNPVLESAKKKKSERNQRRLEQMTKDLKLSDAQHKAVADLLKRDDDEKYGVIKEAADKIEAVSADTEARILAQLTEEQKARYTGAPAAVAKEDENGLLKVFK